MLLGCAELHTRVQSLEVGFKTREVFEGLLATVPADVWPIELRHCVQNLR